MATITFDKLKYVDALKAGGLPEAQARVHAEALAQALAEGPELASKADLREMELRLETKIEASKAEILKWMFGAMVAQTGLIVALLKLLP
jgi:hypothetical protein